MTYNPFVYYSNKSKILIVNYSADFRSITPITSDYIGKITPMDAPIQGFSASTCIKVISTVRWNLRDSVGTSTSIKTTALLYSGSS